MALRSHRQHCEAAGARSAFLVLTLRLILCTSVICAMLCLISLGIGQRIHNPQLLYAGDWDSLYLTDMRQHRTVSLLDPQSTIPVAFGWLPDGVSLTYTLLDPDTGGFPLAGTYSLYLTRPGIRQGQPLLITQLASPFPSWAPDSSRFAFVSVDHDLCFYTLSTTTLRCLNLPGISTVVWSPDNQRLVYSRSDGDQSGLYLTDATGSQHRRLVAPPPGKALLQPVWSPDGKRLVYLVDNNPMKDVDPSSVRELYELDLSEGTPHRLITGEQSGFIFGVVWSPDGTRLAYHASRDDQADIYILNLDDLTEQRITDDLADKGGVQWSPDSARLAYISNRATAINPYRNPVVFWQNVSGSDDTFPHPIAQTVSYHVIWRP